MFYHEQIIFISNYFIKKIRESEHYNIDGTFVYPQGFQQLIIILYYDRKSNKRCPGLFALVNNKKEAGYRYLFTTIKRILTLENTKNLKVKHITIDFEKGLINAINSVFPDIKLIGCFYHFVRAIKENFKRFNILTIEEYNTILNDLFFYIFAFHQKIIQMLMQFVINIEIPSLNLLGILRVNGYNILKIEC